MSMNQPIYRESAHAEVDLRLRAAAAARQGRKARTLAIWHRRSASHRTGSAR
ncbi:hypothetical protein [Nocardioides sp.]|uniref:hypothetical protein n=1 Tax=Nocardioides sp. TaxID=35761 RepID=UPI00378369E5